MLLRDAEAPFGFERLHALPQRPYASCRVRSDYPLCRQGVQRISARVKKELPERWRVQDEKLRWVSHAEANAICNAARSGTPLRGGTLYVTTFPCSSCARAIVQSGIARVFSHGEYWYKDPNGYEKSIAALSEAGVKIDAPEMRDQDHKLRQLGREYLKKTAANSGV